MRACFTMRLKPERIHDYLEVHSNVWPEMLEALRDSGWSNYSLFLAGEGLVVGYVEADDFATALHNINQRSVNSRWQKLMADYFVDGITPDKTMTQLTEYFHLD